MRLIRNKLFPCLIGFSASFAYGAVLGSFVFNAIAWHMAGPAQTFEQAYTLVPTNQIYTILTVIISLSSYLVAGYVTSKLSQFQPYLNSLITGLIVLFWSIYLTVSSPLKVVTINDMTLIFLALSVPVTMIGAYVFAWQSKNG